MLLLFTVNGLYSFIQRLPLPTGKYRLLAREEFEAIDWREVDCSDEATKGYIVEADLHYPFNPAHESFPLCPENTVIPLEDMSPLSQRCLKQFGGAAGMARQRRLVGHFGPRTKYTLHSRLLRFYLRNGMKLVKVHKVLEFEQRPFLKEFVDFMIEARKNATTEHEKLLYKLFLNSTYGRTIMNKFKYLQAFIIPNDSELIRKWASDIRFEGFKLISNNASIIFRKPRSVLLNTLCCVGFSILDLSKEYMYSQYYTKFVPRLGGPENCKVLYSDSKWWW